MRIITALNNPQLNNKLKEEKEYQILSKDIQYKEAILEILEKYRKINIIIINEEIPGEITLIELIRKVNIIDKKIRIIIILKNKDIKKENILRQNGIKEIYYKDFITEKEIKKIIENNNKNKINNKIKKYKKKIINKKIINNKIKNNNKKEINNKIKKSNNKIINNKTNNGNRIKDKIINDKDTKVKKEVYNISNKKIDNEKIAKIINIIGNKKTGKTTLGILLSKYLINKSKKILFINFNYKKNIYLKNNKKNNNIYFINGLKSILRQFKIKDDKDIYQRYIEFIRINNKKYDYIIVDIEKENKKYLNMEEFKNNIKNILLIEGNINSIKKMNKSNNFNNIKNLYIIENKYYFNSINPQIIKKCLKVSSNIYKISKRKKYKSILENNFQKEKEEIKLDINIRRIFFKILYN